MPTATPIINPTTFPTIFPAARFSTLSSLLNVIVPNLMIGAAVILFIMITLGGFSYVQSHGNPENLKKAQALFLYSLIGFIIVISSFLIIKLIGSIFNLGELPF